jgi:hypothetical protein
MLLFSCLSFPTNLPSQKATGSATLLFSCLSFPIHLPSQNATGSPNFSSAASVFPYLCLHQRLQGVPHVFSCSSFPVHLPSQKVTAHKKQTSYGIKQGELSKLSFYTCSGHKNRDTIERTSYQRNIECEIRESVQQHEVCMVLDKTIGMVSSDFVPTFN